MRSSPLALFELMHIQKHWRAAAAMRAQGITLIELLVTLVIAGILVGIGAPSFSNMMGKYRVGAEQSALVADLVLAREEAKNSAAPMTVCASSNGTSCTASAWRDGHIVFRDGGTAGAVDGADAVVRVAAAAKGGISIAATLNASNAAYSGTYLQFDADGRLAGANALKFTTCLAGQLPQYVVVRLNGHVSASAGSAACS